MLNPKLLLAALGLMLIASVSLAGECCDQCGCECCVRKVCRLKCETNKVPKTTYCCECEDFCVPGPSKMCGCTCETDCRGCEHCKTNWIPQCAQVRTRTKLVKHVEEKEEKVYKWVVEYVCDNCANCGGQCAAQGAGQCAATDKAPEAPVQATPAPTAPVQKVSFLNSLFRAKKTAE